MCIILIIILLNIEATFTLEPTIIKIDDQFHSVFSCKHKIMTNDTEIINEKFFVSFLNGTILFSQNRAGSFQILDSSLIFFKNLNYSTRSLESKTFLPYFIFFNTNLKMKNY